MIICDNLIKVMNNVHPFRGGNDAKTVQTDQLSYNHRRNRAIPLLYMCIECNLFNQNKRTQN